MLLISSTPDDELESDSVSESDEEEEEEDDDDDVDDVDDDKDDKIDEDRDDEALLEDTGGDEPRSEAVLARLDEVTRPGKIEDVATTTRVLGVCVGDVAPLSGGAADNLVSSCSLRNALSFLVLSEILA